MVARCGSLAQAAQVMYLTIPALSRRIHLLESHLGVKLFRRLPRGLSLTETGGTYYAALAPAWERIVAATEAVRRHAQDKHTLKVSVMPTFAANWLMPVVDRFHKRHPHLQVMLEIAPDCVDLGGRAWPPLPGRQASPGSGLPMPQCAPAPPAEPLRSTITDKDAATRMTPTSAKQSE
jgi:LysR family transcriptional regulator, glycine cleavage system transcriptional activator